jgi:hypothetical protein
MTNEDAQNKVYLGTYKSPYFQNRKSRSRGSLREDPSLPVTAEDTLSLLQWDFHRLFLLKCVNYHRHHPRLHIRSHVS